MRRGLIALGGATVTVAGVVLWRRRRAAARRPVVHLGLGDGAAAALDSADPAVPGLQELAAGLRHHFEIGG